MTTKSPLPADVAIGAKIRLRRMELGMSQEKLGDLLGVTFQQCQKYEKGTNRVGGSRLDQIARALGVKPAYFFGDDFQGDDTPMKLDKVALDIAIKVQAMAPDQRRSVATIVDAIIDATQPGLAAAA